MHCNKPDVHNTAVKCLSHLQNSDIHYIVKELIHLDKVGRQNILNHFSHYYKNSFGEASPLPPFIQVNNFNGKLKKIYMSQSESTSKPHEMNS